MHQIRLFQNSAPKNFNQSFSNQIKGQKNIKTGVVNFLNNPSKQQEKKVNKNLPGNTRVLLTTPNIDLKNFHFFEPVKHVVTQIQFHDKISDKLKDVQVQIFIPGENVVKNGHLIMISNGAMVGAGEYSQLSERLAMLGYIVVIADYRVNLEFVYPNLKHDIALPNQIVLHTILKKLVYRDQNEDSLPDIDFNDVIILGHSLGGYYQILDARNPKPFFQPFFLFFNKFLPSVKDVCWDKYVKGIILYEGCTTENLPVPKQQFLSVIGSEFRADLLSKLQGKVNKEMNVSYHVIKNANHYLVNDFQGPKQIVPGAKIAGGQENFTTTFEEWNQGQKLLSQIIDEEIRSRLDKDDSKYSQLTSFLRAAQNLPQRDLQTISQFQ